MPDRTPPGPLTLAAAGLAAGVIAAAVMNGAQTLLKPLAGDTGGGDSATVKAADDLATATTGAPVPKPEREAAGNAMHYALGAALGGAYALGGGHVPAVRAGFGAAFGAGTMLVMDDAVVPAAGWGAPPWQTSPRLHAYSLLSHLVFGAALEGALRLLLGLADRGR